MRGKKRKCSGKALGEKRKNRWKIREGKKERKEEGREVGKDWEGKEGKKKWGKEGREGRVERVREGREEGKEGERWIWEQERDGRVDFFLFSFYSPSGISLFFCHSLSLFVRLFVCVYLCLLVLWVFCLWIFVLDLCSYFICSECLFKCFFLLLSFFFNFSKLFMCPGLQ